ncbi:Cdc37 N terminal kinase binding-domain-containing protein [Lipomyces arxii]|uniref:Cdc37 N terminal kinase binding-domain-containing protein n=1 Tax=Lipomyces arxii TaxID=56418 RepID=UPI0034CE50A7
MVVDYSKWDKLEVSDDSDVEVHPNVDKKSFIRWKQRDIHEKRDQRKHEIESLQAENLMNSNLLKRVDAILEKLSTADDIDRVLLEACKDSDDDKKVGSGPSYGVMMQSLIDQVVHEAKASSGPYVESLTQILTKHYAKLTSLQDECLKKLAELQAEDAKHITSDDLHIGFDSTRVAKHDKPEPSKPFASKKVTDKGKKTETIEVLNQPQEDKGYEGGDDDDDDEPYRASPLAQEFAKIPLGNYQKCLDFIAKHPTIISEDQADGILFDAFGEEMAGRSKVAKTHVHNALLLQYCARLGSDGVAVFFRKIMMPNSPALGAFMQDVDTTYNHIKTRSKILAEEQGQEEEEELIDLEELDDEQLAQYGLTKEDVARFKQEQIDKEKSTANQE